MRETRKKGRYPAVCIPDNVTIRREPKEQGLVGKALRRINKNEVREKE
jgi:hypothetical protein